jgi:hypothetical protein
MLISNKTSKTSWNRNFKCDIECVGAIDGETGHGREQANRKPNLELWRGNKHSHNTQDTQIDIHVK